MQTVCLPIDHVVKTISEQHRMSHEEMDEVLRFSFIETMINYSDKYDYPLLSYDGYRTTRKDNFWVHVPRTPYEHEIITDVLIIFKDYFERCLNIVIDSFKTTQLNQELGLRITTIEYGVSNLYVVYEDNHLA